MTNVIRKVIALVLLLSLLTGCTTSSCEQLATPDVPQTPDYPGAFSDDEAYAAWREDVNARASITGYEDALAPFLAASVPAILSDSGDGNRVFSPVCLYTALAMLAEVTGGDTRAQVLALTGCSDLGTLRSTTSALWNANYRDDGAVTRTLAASLWLSDALPFRQETVDALATHHYASAYRVRMGSAGADNALRDWLNQHTLNLLTEQVEGISMPADTLAAIATTVAFSARWCTEFDPERTAPGIFHGVTGDFTIDFLHADRRDTLYWGDRFRAVSLSFDMNGGTMWIILPDEGVTPDDLLSDADCLALLTGQGCDNGSNMLIHMAIPKFDVTSQLELSGQLQALGVTAAFDAAVSDFTPLTADETPLALSRVQHDARVVIDEEGCKAAAYTVMMLAGASAPRQLEEVDFIVDSPFLFVITGAGGLPLFVGVVNAP